MDDHVPPRLSELVERLDASDPSFREEREADVEREVLVLGGGPLANADEPSSRRAFLARASTLSLAIPGVGAALAACAPGQQAASDTGRRDTGRAAGGGLRDWLRHRNSDSKLDSAVLHDVNHGNSSATPAATAGAASTPYHRFDPTLPPPATGGRVQLHWHAREAPIRISDDTVIAGWTFEGDIPGPIVHCHVGDTVEFTLTNDVDIPHSMDFHAAQIDPREAFKSVVKGASVSFTFKPKYAGGFMYHCGTAPVLMHIGSGMYGAIIVSPREGLPPAKEFVLVQSEYYLADAVNGVHASDYQKMLSTMPSLVVFNGRPNQYVKEPIRVKVGDRVRFWVVSAGPSHPCNFHVVGDQFDTVYLGAPPGTPLRGVQTWSVPPGGGIVYDLVCDTPGEFPFVNHGFGHGQKGAIGFLVVE